MAFETTESDNDLAWCQHLSTKNTGSSLAVLQVFREKLQPVAWVPLGSFRSAGEGTGSLQDARARRPPPGSWASVGVHGIVLSFCGPNS